MPMCLSSPPYTCPFVPKYLLQVLCLILSFLILVENPDHFALLSLVLSVSYHAVTLSFSESMFSLLFSQSFMSISALDLLFFFFLCVMFLDLLFSKLDLYDSGSQIHQRTTSPRSWAFQLSAATSCATIQPPEANVWPTQAREWFPLFGVCCALGHD
jgi:hypothetical protein